MFSIMRQVRDKLDQIGAEPDPIYPEPTSIWDRRTNEPNFGVLNDVDAKSENCYGQKIDLLELTEQADSISDSLFINANPAVGENPNRYKQHGFHFTADNCIGCHACEAACSEKNGNPAHISFRSVGYVEGGTYPDYHRMNISMACNHCDDPVCLKGCPTRAYTKHLEYGAVLQDPDTCFGCGYCTWVCPYNAPQLDPVQGQVSKCNMCVDRLEVGLKPACVSACLGNALEFGVVENTPVNREQVSTQLPGFPDPSITQPNIRFQQIKSLPDEVTRTDSMPIKYNKNPGAEFRSVVDEKLGKQKYWNLSRLSSRENPLVIFTLVTQAAIGAFSLYFIAPFFGVDWLRSIPKALALTFLLSLLAIQLGALVLSTIHLGKPWRFYRGFNNLQHSPLSREALAVATFFGALCGFTLFELLQWKWPLLPIMWMRQLMGSIALVAGLIGIVFMTQIYRIKARPFWDHWQVATAFFGSVFSLGGLLLGMAFVPMALQQTEWDSKPLVMMSTMIFVGLMMEAIGLMAHGRHLNSEGGEGAAAHYVQCTTFGHTYTLRNGLLFVLLCLSVSSAFLATNIVWYSVLFVFMLVLGLTVALVSRALFYVLVIPTTMPGAFFWKNKSFEQHARDTGLADLPQVGIVPDAHH